MFSGGGGISASPEGRRRDRTWEERKERKYQGLKEREVGRCVGPGTNSSWATFWILRNDGRWGQSSQQSFVAHFRPSDRVILRALEQNGGDTFWRWCQSWALKSEGSWKERSWADFSRDQRCRVPSRKDNSSAGNHVRGSSQADSSIVSVCIFREMSSLSTPEFAFFISGVVQKSQVESKGGVCTGLQEARVWLWKSLFAHCAKGIEVYLEGL